MSRTARRVIIDITAPSVAWRKALPRAAALARTAAEAALEHGLAKAPMRKALGPTLPLEVSIALTTNAAVRTLNRTYRGKDKPTNVLSFPAEAPPGESWLLGDVVVAYGVAAAEARTESKKLAAHLTHLVIHGVLHLLGYDHDNDHDAAVMERLEITIMARMGFADPYATLPAAKRARPKATVRRIAERT